MDTSEPIASAAPSTDRSVSPTARRLEEHALRLFAERGFDAVTVEEIAAAAGVSHMTFYRHFPTKESVVLDDPYDPLIGAAVARQDRARGPIQRVVGGILEAWAEIDAGDEAALRARLRLAAGHPGLRARVWENNHRTEMVVTTALVDTGVDGLDARVAAGAVLGALTAALLDWAEHGDGTMGARIGRALTLVAGWTGQGVDDGSDGS